MRHYFFFLFFSLTILSTFGQNKDTWTVIWDEDSTHLGFEDQFGNIKISPKFEKSMFGQIYKFDNIVALMRKNGEKYESYYLTKSQKVAGVDSVYVFDYAVDCESEGFIRFIGEDSKVGMLNRHGNIAIPAIYDALTKVRNGMVIGLMDAQKKYWNIENEHPDKFGLFSWVGGNEVLLDTNNLIIAEKINVQTPFDFHSLKLESKANENKTKRSIKAKNGMYYTFIDYEEEFKVWLADVFLEKLRANEYEPVIFDQVICNTSKLKGKISKEDMLSKHLSNFKKMIFTPFDYGYEYSFNIEDPNTFIYEDEIYRQFLNNCGDSDKWIYPDMIFEAKSDKSYYSFHFIRLGDNDYKLTYCYQD